MSDLNDKLDNVIKILQVNKKQYIEDIKNINNKLESSILDINKHLDSLEKKINKNKILLKKWTKKTS